MENCGSSPKQRSEHQEKDGWTLLMIACRDGETEIAKMLITKGANIHNQNKGETAPSLAMDLAYNPDIPFHNEYQETVLLLVNEEAAAKSTKGNKTGTVQQ